MPWITATTATRNPTDTMIPSSVKNERSLWLHAVWRAWRIASERGMGLQNSGKRDARCGMGGCGAASRIPHPASRYSYLSASIGSSRAARLAGYSPNPTPVRADAPSAATRSEEHTSELQSQSNLVCRLLLEKKKANLRSNQARPQSRLHSILL